MSAPDAPQPPTSAAAASSIHEADDVLIVLDARRLRRHFRWAWRVILLLLIAALLWGGAQMVLFVAAFRCHAVQNDAKGNLKALMVHQLAFFDEHDVFSDDLAALGFSARGAPNRYRYVVTDVSGVGASATFRAWAFTDPSYISIVDVWSIDGHSNLVNLSNGCSR